MEDLLLEVVEKLTIKEDGDLLQEWDQLLNLVLKLKPELLIVNNKVAALVVHMFLEPNMVVRDHNLGVTDHNSVEVAVILMQEKIDNGEEILDLKSFINNL
jgi:hypothetical protein